MRQIFLFVTLFFVFAQPVFAVERVLYAEKATISITGTIQAIGGNFIEILDEDDQRVKRLNSFWEQDGLKIGDRVRIWYDVRYRMVEQMRHLTSVEYKKNGQNGGYVFKESSADQGIKAEAMRKKKNR